MQIVDGVKYGYEEKLKVNVIELENKKLIVAEAEVCTAMVTKEEHNKEIEREKHKNIIKILTINYNQELIELKNIQTEIFMLKEGRGKSNVRHEAMK